MPKYSKVIASSQQVLETQYGYQQVMPNLIEPESLYRKTLGVTSDIVLKEMYEVVSSGSGNSTKDKQILRPEGTAGVLRSILGDKDLAQRVRKETIKTWYWGPMFRHERPQAGRLRQFYQLGMEQIGGTSGDSNDYGHIIQTDFEAIESAWDCLQSIFMEHSNQIAFEVEINNLGGEKTLTEYNRALTSLLKPRMADFSNAS